MAAKGKTKKSTKGSDAKKAKSGGSNSDSRIIRIVLGVVFAVLAIYSLVVMISYCNTWHKDQSLASNPSMYDASQAVHDAGGKLGFKWASFFISEAFGLGAFVLPFLFAALSAFCFKTRRVNIVRVSLLSVSGAVIFSVLLGFISRLCHAEAFLGNGAGGAYGHYASDWLCNM
ncbi:MAG: DNA translocase FtsK 4TM domain-containing protein, partial [Bacteroidales bacterium]|nr:DNA translocase FtsK 4TM domain-containing protein [Bacteroidales bacterium]